MLAKLQDLIDRIRGRARKPSGKPFGLTDHEVRALKELTTSDNWPDYLNLLDTVCKLKVEAALLDRADNAWDRGFISGLRRAGTLPAEIIQRVEQERTEQHERAERSADRDNQRQRFATFGSGWWDGRQSIGNGGGGNK